MRGRNETRKTPEHTLREQGAVVRIHSLRPFNQRLSIRRLSGEDCATASRMGVEVAPITFSVVGGHHTGVPIASAGRIIRRRRES
jgi:hypothetical protein